MAERASELNSCWKPVRQNKGRNSRSNRKHQVLFTKWNENRKVNRERSNRFDREERTARSQDLLFHYRKSNQTIYLRVLNLNYLGSNFAANELHLLLKKHSGVIN